ncbi:hypothetical protein V8G54_034631 [Vigna mungo]|uniref:Uncharacterized protein n=1 Tax=Vigna mungo TaxID=3915 RepID=A0AAQ3MR70_VIGMU
MCANGKTAFPHMDPSDLTTHNVFEYKLSRILFVRGSSQKSEFKERLAFRVSIVGASSLRVSKEKLAYRLSIVGAVLFELAECSSSGSFVEGSTVAHHQLKHERGSLSNHRWTLFSTAQQLIALSLTNVAFIPRKCDNTL